MQTTDLFTRRRLFRFAATLLCMQPRFRAVLEAGTLCPLFDVNDAPGHIPASAGGADIKHYRIHAAIYLLSVPMLTRRNVGAAVISTEDSCSGQQNMTGIQLAAGSWPDRAHGLNRFGMTREIVRQIDGAIIETSYLIFMTSSPEKTLDQAHRSLRASSDAITLSVAHGRSTRDRQSASLEHVNLPGHATWMDGPELADNLQPQTSGWPLKEQAQSEAVATFLFAVRQAVRAGQPTRRCPFVHNGSRYALEMTTAGPQSGMQGTKTFCGRFRKELETASTDFTLWYGGHDPSLLPMRFDFRPKSFLRLTFEEDPALAGPNIRPLLDEESVR